MPPLGHRISLAGATPIRVPCRRSTNSMRGSRGASAREGPTPSRSRSRSTSTRVCAALGARDTPVRRVRVPPPTKRCSHHARRPDDSTIASASRRSDSSCVEGASTPCGSGTGERARSRRRRPSTFCSRRERSGRRCSSRTPVSAGGAGAGADHMCHLGALAVTVFPSSIGADTTYLKRLGLSDFYLERRGLGIDRRGRTMEAPRERLASRVQRGSRIARPKKGGPPQPSAMGAPPEGTHPPFPKGDRGRG